MLKKNSGPVLNECKLNADDKSILPPACPINFNTSKDDVSWHSRFKKEIASLATWYDLSIKRRGRTTFGLSNSSIIEIADGLTLWIDNKNNQIPDYAWIKLALDDIKIYSEIKNSTDQTLENSSLIELSCDKVQDKLIAVKSQEIISVQIYEKSSVAGGSKRPGFSLNID